MQQPFPDYFRHSDFSKVISLRERKNKYPSISCLDIVLFLSFPPSQKGNKKVFLNERHNLFYTHATIKWKSFFSSLLPPIKGKKEKTRASKGFFLFTTIRKSSRTNARDRYACSMPCNSRPCCSFLFYQGKKGGLLSRA